MGGLVYASFSLPTKYPMEEVRYTIHYPYWLHFKHFINNNNKCLNLNVELVSSIIR